MCVNADMFFCNMFRPEIWLDLCIDWTEPIQSPMRNYNSFISVTWLTYRKVYLIIAQTLFIFFRSKSNAEKTKCIHTSGKHNAEKYHYIKVGNK